MDRLFSGHVGSSYCHVFRLYCKGTVFFLNIRNWTIVVLKRNVRLVGVMRLHCIVNLLSRQNLHWRYCQIVWNVVQCFMSTLRHCIPFLHEWLEERQYLYWKTNVCFNCHSFFLAQCQQDKYAFINSKLNVLFFIYSGHK